MLQESGVSCEHSLLAPLLALTNLDWPSTVNSIFAIANIVVMVVGVAFLVRSAWGIHTRGLGNTLAQPYFRLRWRFVLPVLGLLGFSSISYHSLRMNRQFGPTPRSYYWWSSIRLDTDPLNRRPQTPPPCNAAVQDCGWELRAAWIEPAYYDESFVLAALPAFILSTLTVSRLSRLGINEVWSFAISMPAYTFAWFYLVGWLIERWLSKRRCMTGTSPD